MNVSEQILIEYPFCGKDELYEFLCLSSPDEFTKEFGCYYWPDMIDVIEKSSYCTFEKMLLKNISEKNKDVFLFHYYLYRGNEEQINNFIKNCNLNLFQFNLILYYTKEKYFDEIYQLYFSEKINSELEYEIKNATKRIKFLHPFLLEKTFNFAPKNMKMFKIYVEILYPKKEKIQKWLSSFSKIELKNLNKNLISSIKYYYYLDFPEIDIPTVKIITFPNIQTFLDKKNAI